MIIESAKAVLQRYWGHPSFRPLQEEIIQATLDKRDVLALMPTGGGKSVCFQVPALLQEGVCLVVSPLIALMQDQVTQLRKKGLAATALHMGMGAQEMEMALNDCVRGAMKFLYISAERLQTERFQAYVARMKVCLLAIDEAHCISQWGHDFRPAYRNIAVIKPFIGKVPLLALTATATHKVKLDIIAKLALEKPVILEKSFARTNLSLRVERTEDNFTSLLSWLDKVPGSAIVYTGSRKATRWVADHLKIKGIEATYYHAGLTTEERTKRQEAWIKGSIRIMVATNAFGMGIDKPNVRLVLHLHFPNTLEGYYQEAGRAGRDGKMAYAIVLRQKYQVAKFRRKVAESQPSLALIKKVYQSLVDYHKISMDREERVSYPFDIEHFADVYEMNISSVHTVLQRLQNAGIIEYNDRYACPAQVCITFPTQSHYDLLMRNPSYDLLVNTLQDMYESFVFTGFTEISLKRLARWLAMSPQSVHHILKAMEADKLLTYIPQAKEAYLTFFTPYYKVGELPISSQDILVRKHSMQDKAKNIIHYMMHKARCRMQMILEYFGEVSYTQCALCDICIAKQREKNFNTTIYRPCRQRILHLLRQKSLSLEALMGQLTQTVSKEDILATLHRMMADDELGYTDQFEFVLQRL